MIYLLLLSSLAAHAQPLSRTLQQGQARYRVSYLTKNVSATSKEVKGKMVCAASCEFLVAIPIKSFDSGDSNRDLNMQTTVDAVAFPIVTAAGSFDSALWGNRQFVLEAKVTFHGVTETYPVSVSEGGKVAKLTIELERHKIKRPSLFGISISNEVPVEFSFSWDKD